MISLNSFNEIIDENNANDASRRRRTPSKYADSIKELTKLTGKNYRRDRYSEDVDEESSPLNPSRQERPQGLTCILPTSGRKLKISIIIKKQPKPKFKKSISAVSIEKEKERDKEKTKNTSLLETLMQVVEQYKADEENKRDEVVRSEAGSAIAQASKKEGRPKKEKQEEEKYCRLYEKYRILNQKFEQAENQLLLM